jgi:hypothetical protein
MTTKVIEFRDTDDYEAWLRAQGDRVRVVATNTTKRWTPMLGFLGNAKTYTVTYEEVSARPIDRG